MSNLPTRNHIIRMNLADKDLLRHTKRKMKGQTELGYQPKTRIGFIQPKTKK